MRSPSPNSAYGRRAASGRDCVPDRIRSATLLFVRWGQHRGQNPNLRTDAIHLGRSNQKTRLARHLTDCVGQAHGAGGGRVSTRVPQLRRRHSADALMRRTSAPSVKNQRSEGSLGLGIPAPTGTVGTSQPAARTRTRLIERKTVPEVPLTGLSFEENQGV